MMIKRWRPYWAKRWQPFRRMSNEEMERLFEEWPLRWHPRTRHGRAVREWAPRLDMFHREDRVVVKVELPGVDREDIDISVIGDVVTIKEVVDDDELMIISQKGVLIRLPIRDISVIGRNTQGVRLINLDEGDRVIDVARVMTKEEEDKGQEREMGEGGVEEEAEQPPDEETEGEEEQ